MWRPGSYFFATRHPWSCVTFVLPLLLIYETGLNLLRTDQPDSLRNGADTWLRYGLAHLGFAETYWAPVLLVGILFAWSLLRRTDRPEDFLGTWVGMAVESGLYALGLWALSRGLLPTLEGLGVMVGGEAGTATAPTTGQPLRWLLDSTSAAGAAAHVPEPALEQVVSFIGAGVYEETLFRLLLFSGLAWGLKLLDLPGPLSALGATLGSALLFAAAHNFGPNGEPFHAFVFAFRTLAGVYFTFLYQFRGFGIAVGAHAGYDVLVGVLAP